jgi:Spy/CpxP family protein refolding chaperone
MKFLTVVVFTLSTLFAMPSFAQGAPATAAPAPISSADMQILRDKIKADKKLVVAANMRLTDDQAKAFWPIYDAYQADLEKINQRTAKLIGSYAEAWNNNSVDNGVAKKLTTEMLAIEQAEVDLRKGYAAKLNKVLPAVLTGRYLQIEGKIRAVIRYDLASKIPLAQTDK